MKTFTILLDGALTLSPRLLRQLRGTRIIAADGGIRHALPLSLTPELWLGDFDSAELALQRRFSAVPQQSFPADKDKTDGELAADAALERGAERLILCGAFGGERPDHSLQHITSALALARRGIASLLTDGATEGAPLLPGRHAFDWPEETLFSLIGLADIEGLAIRGAKWEMAERPLPLGSSLTLSNESCGRVEISLRSGYGIVMAKPHL